MCCQCQNYFDLIYIDYLLIAFFTVLSGTYFAQKPYLKRLPYKLRGSVVVACLVASVATYGVQSVNKYRLGQKLKNDISCKVESKEHNV